MHGDENYHFDFCASEEITPELLLANKITGQCVMAISSQFSGEKFFFPASTNLCEIVLLL